MGTWSILPTKDRNDVLNRNDEESIVAFEIHGDAVLWVEENAVVLLDRVVLIARDLGADLDDTTCDRRDFDLVGQVNSGLRDFLVLVLSDQNAVAERLDCFDGGLFSALSWHAHYSSQ